MSYFKINGIDFSMYVNALSVDKTARYNAQTNAAGDTIADYINSKREIAVGIIPLDDAAMSKLLAAVDGFNVTISFRNPLTNQLEENINCIIPKSAVSYYTIRADKVMYKAFNLTFTEL